MVNDFLHFLLHLVLGLLLDALNRVLNYLIQPLPRWQVWLVRVAAVVSTAGALVMFSEGYGRGSIAPFLLLFLVSRPLPVRGRWQFVLFTSCLFLAVVGIPLTWLQMHL